MEPLIGAGAAFAIALATTPVGVSGEVAPAALAARLPHVHRRRLVRAAQPRGGRRGRPGVGPRPRDRSRGLAGGWCGAALQPGAPEALLRRGLGVIAVVLGVRYAVLAL
jgi:hypothetical protein